VRGEATSSSLVECMSVIRVGQKVWCNHTCLRIVNGMLWVEVMQMKTSIVYYSAKSTPLVTEIFGFLWSRVSLSEAAERLLGRVTSVWACIFPFWGGIAQEGTKQVCPNDMFVTLVVGAQLRYFATWRRFSFTSKFAQCNSPSHQYPKASFPLRWKGRNIWDNSGYL